MEQETIIQKGLKIIKPKKRIKNENILVRRVKRGKNPRNCEKLESRVKSVKMPNRWGLEQKLLLFSSLNQKNNAALTTESQNQTLAPLVGNKSVKPNKLRGQEMKNIPIVFIKSDEHAC